MATEHEETPETWAVWVKENLLPAVADGMLDLVLAEVAYAVRYRATKVMPEKFKDEPAMPERPGVTSGFDAATGVLVDPENQYAAILAQPDYLAILGNGVTVMPSRRNLAPRSRIAAGAFRWSGNEYMASDVIGRRFVHVRPYAVKSSTNVKLGVLPANTVWRIVSAEENRFRAVLCKHTVQPPLDGLAADLVKHAHLYEEPRVFRYDYHQILEA